MTRYTTTGSVRTHIVHHGYQDRSRFSSRWEHPAGEPSLAAGSALLIGLVLIAVGFLIAFGG